MFFSDDSKYQLPMKSYAEFLGIWNLVMYGLAGLAILSAFTTIIIHKSRLGAQKTYKEKYDYLRDHSARMNFTAMIFLSVAITFIINTLYHETVVSSVFWIFIRLFIAICIGTLIYYVSHLLFKYTYPARLRKSLNEFRYKPRINPKTGNKMKLLSEEEEDVHLEEGMQAEENVFSVDYDVWVDEATGDVHIEKYPGHLEARRCNTCGFQTMRQVEEKILVEPTEYSEGELQRHYQCRYCGANRNKVHKIAKLSQDADNYQLPDKLVFKSDEGVSSVTIQIALGTGQTLSYDFYSTKQASEFLEEFDVENIQE
jgi:hypothetical protein